MIRQLGKVFVLDTDNTTYCFKVLKTGHLEHLYYGEKIEITEEAEADVLSEKHAFAPGNTNIYDQDNPEFTLEDMRLEISSYGKGDIREPFVEIAHNDGGLTSDFLYSSCEIKEGKEALNTMPSAYDDEKSVSELIIKLICNNYGETLELHYSVFEGRDVIVRSSKLINTSNDTISVRRLMSNQLDFERSDYVFTSFNGGWAKEMNRKDNKISAGKYINSSYTGSSSNRANPFVMISEEKTTEDNGICYGINLVYSGNHYESCDVNSFDKLRFISGINPASFEFKLAVGDNLEAPESVMTFSTEGYNGMSQRMHGFVQDCIVRGKWKKKTRPVLLNSWEAAYFDINESKILKLAKAGKDVGVELFVMDDGWFGTRDDDKQSLGDWKVNTKKLPNGVSGLCKKINDLGLMFGIWVEPEMVNVNSELYRKHPDWTIEIPNKDHSEGRNQRILDLANPEVVNHMIKQMEEVLSSANIAYVKWDMNRTFTDYYSQYLPKDRQGETAHRYILGLYRMMKTLTEEFPDILFEGCAAGGNRFDLGILSFFPQIWASDDTDAVYRVNGMTGYSYGYPMSTVTAHVSACPNHQTLRITPLQTRFNVAAFGVCGYECNLCDMKKEELEEIKTQIKIYKEWREVLQYGHFYRGRNGNIHEWTCVSFDQKKAVGMIMQELVYPNSQFHQYFPKGLDKKQKYSFTNREIRYNIKGFGDLVNTASPVHIKQDSIVHNVLAKFVTMPGESEQYKASGSVLMSGVKLKQAFAATGYNEQTRYFQDFASRIYFMEG